MNVYSLLKDTCSLETYKDTQKVKLSKTQMLDLQNLFSTLRDVFIMRPKLSFTDIYRYCHSVLLPNKSQIYKQIMFDVAKLAVWHDIDDKAFNQTLFELVNFLRNILITHYAHFYRFNMFAPQSINQAKFMSALDGKQIKYLNTDDEDKTKKSIFFSGSNNVMYKIKLPQWSFVVANHVNEHRYLVYEPCSKDYQHCKKVLKQSSSYKYDEMLISYYYFLKSILFLCKYMRNTPTQAKKSLKSIPHLY